MKNYRLDRERALFLFIDLQDKLLKAIYQNERVLKYNKVLAEMSKIMKIESLITVQYPKGLGNTNKDLLDILNQEEIAKTEFSCMLNKDFRRAIESTGKKQVVVSGIEGHICVLLTVRDLIEKGYEVFIASDAISSRTEFNYKNSLALMSEMGCVVTNTESIMFDLNSVSGTDEFKKVQKLII
ncbi:isochorismatase family protein [Peptoniphilus catoniae]|uniref:isochorismatase family protein n=1 Tax=Peptoniphilus catoniae TaxID=1660341 RepID=UPI0010FE0AF6|nr:isochorismatase family protein [Peptoniphilus catoniae]